MKYIKEKIFESICLFVLLACLVVIGLLLGWGGDNMKDIDVREVLGYVSIALLFIGSLCIIF